eukprot:m.313 g.313  ORF g.313 m.313 type:complete len:173 (+) comp169_c0_seq1:103-621(+)
MVMDSSLDSSSHCNPVISYPLRHTMSVAVDEKAFGDCNSELLEVGMSVANPNQNCLLVNCPEEIIVAILNYLSSNDLVHACHSCRRLGYCGEYAWQKVAGKLPRYPRGYYAIAPFPVRYLALKKFCVRCFRPARRVIMQKDRLVIGRACRVCVFDETFQSIMRNRCLFLEAS